MELLETMKQLDAKQKVTGVITVILLGILIYLAYDTFAGGDSSAPPAPKQTTASAPPITPHQDSDSAGDGTSVQMHQPPGQAAIQDPIAQHHLSGHSDDDEITKQHTDKPSVEQLALLQQTKKMQQQYLQLVNEYQLAQLQQKVEAAKSQIAEARLKSMVNSAKQQQLEAELQQKGQMIAGPSIGGGHGEAAQGGLQAVYVGERRSQWSAMLSEGSSYFEVHVGTRLAGGWRVTSISSQGVILQRGDEKRLLRMPRIMG